MGQGATSGRRALIDHVRQCLAQTNAMTGLATQVREAHNAFSAKTVEEVARLEGRLNTLGTWCKRVEAHDTLTREIATDLLRRVDLLERQDTAFATMSFTARLRWLLTGVRPAPIAARPLEGGAMALITAADAAVIKADAARVKKAVDAGFSDAAPYGRMTGGMAPRPLP